MQVTGLEFEQQIYSYVDQIKDLLSPKIWENILLDCSKNEIFVLWLLYRRREVNMSQVAEYVNVPLNTATGIITRMEKRGLVIRERSEQDKRVVTIRMGEQGEQQMQSMMREMFRIGGKVLDSFSEEEVELLFRMMQKVVAVMCEERESSHNKPGIRKITIE